MKKKKYYIGKPVLFRNENSEIDIGEITEIIATEKRIKYMIRALPEESAEEVWYHIVTKDDIVECKNSYKPQNDDWAVAHINEINKVFGRDVSEYLIIIYDSLYDAEEEFDDFARDERFCRQVLNKWVFLAA